MIKSGQILLLFSRNCVKAGSEHRLPSWKAVFSQRNGTPTQAASFTEQELRAGLAKLSELDFAVKSGRLSDQMAVELVLADFGRSK